MVGEAAEAAYLTKSEDAEEEEEVLLGEAEEYVLGSWSCFASA